MTGHVLPVQAKKPVSIKSFCIKLVVFFTLRFIGKSGFTIIICSFGFTALSTPHPSCTSCPDLFSSYLCKVREDRALSVFIRTLLHVGTGVCSGDNAQILCQHSRDLPHRSGPGWTGLFRSML